MNSGIVPRKEFDCDSDTTTNPSTNPNTITNTSKARVMGLRTLAPVP